MGGCAVDLSNNAGLTLPDDIGELGPEITELDLYNCSLVGTVPPGIGRCVGLRELRLHFNGLTGVAPEIGRCTRLVGLDLSVNALRSAPVAAIAGSLSRPESKHHLALEEPPPAVAPKDWLARSNTRT